jgi:hypothetical protein
MIKRRVEITVQTSRRLRVSTGRATADALCAECGKKVAMVSAEQAARISGVSTRTIYRWIETGQVHFSETHDGVSLICIESIRQLIWS